METENIFDARFFSTVLQKKHWLGLSAKSSRFCEGRVREMHIAAAQLFQFGSGAGIGAAIVTRPAELREDYALRP